MAVAPHRRVALLAAAATAASLTVTALSAGPAPASPARPAGTVVAGDLFISEYIEGSSFNKAVEIYNPTNASVNLTGYEVAIFFNGSTTATTFALGGTLASGDVYVLANTSASTPADPAILAVADQVTTASFFNGDDAVALRKAGPVIVDVIGQIGNDPGSEWGTGLTSTQDNTLVRKAAICAGDTDGSNAFDPSIEWDGFAQNTFANLGSHTSTCLAGDTAPSVSGTTPAGGATNVARDANVVVEFSEPVVAGTGAFDVDCSATGSHPVTVTGGPTQFTLDPDTDFGAAETCTVTVTAAAITDIDGDDPPDTMAAPYLFSFTTVDTAVCGDPATFISAIQGSGATSPVQGNVVTIEGVVVGDYQPSTSLRGFFVQEEDGDRDADPATSEGIFVFDPSTLVDVNPGDVVRVTGTVLEFSSSGQFLTELTSVTSVLVCATGAIVTPTTVTLPVPSLGAWEAVEGMLVEIDQELTVTETFTLARFGEVALSVNGRLPQPTNVVAPGAPALAQQDLNDRSRILLDDGNGQQNIDPTRYPTGGLSASNTLRSGDTVDGLTGVLEQRFGVYRVQPVGPITFDPANPRPATPAAVGGEVKVASFNVLNYFNGDGLGGGFPTSRGAENAAEFTRQRDKIISAIVALDADVVGLMELENDAVGNSAIEDLVNGLNAATGPGTYAFVNTGVIGTDEIRVGIVYQPANVTPAGAHAVLTQSVDPRFLDTKNRPALAQTFVANADGARFTVVVNHLKSKGSACTDVGDPDAGDGQGNCNGTRTAAAEALVDWIATDPTASNDPDFLVIGDLNAYAKEDPITAFTSQGYTDMIEAFAGAGGYSYVFQGQSGYLDHALANAALAPQVTGVTEWHINADEPVALDYNTNFKSANHQTTLYDPGPFRSSDHDPVLIGLSLNAPPTVDAGGPYAVAEGGTVTVSAVGNDPDSGDTLTYAWDLDGDTVFETPGASVTFDAGALAALDSATITVRVTDSAGHTATDQATVGVRYAFTGFTTVPRSGQAHVPAGRTLVVLFGLGGNQGTGVLAGPPTVQQVDCSTRAPIGSATPASLLGGLRYVPGLDRYLLLWNTPRAWAGQCREFRMTLIDGATHVLAVRFR